MVLAPGSRLGPYEILAPLGAGGMGEVYRARDTRLGRDVALKVLSSPVAGDAERLSRFQREARVLATLNHPNIAAIYGLEESGGVPALVMELVEGPTLEERVHRGTATRHHSDPADTGFDIAHRRSAADCRADRRRARVRARSRHRSPRFKTGKYQNLLRWESQGPGFRSRQME